MRNICMCGLHMIRLCTQLLYSQIRAFTSHGILYSKLSVQENSCNYVLADHLCAPVSKTHGYREPWVYSNNKFYPAIGWYHSEVILGQRAWRENCVLHALFNS
jgi:hypothetical protein